MQVLLTEIVTFSFNKQKGQKSFIRIFQIKYALCYGDGLLYFSSQLERDIFSSVLYFILTKEM